MAPAEEESSPSVTIENETSGKKVENAAIETETGTGPRKKLMCLRTRTLIFLLLFVTFFLFCFGGVIFRYFSALSNQSDNANAKDNSQSQKNFLGVNVTVNLTVDPCDDFYEFACGAQSGRNSSLVVDAVFALLGHVLLDNSEAENRNGAEEKAQNFYRSCVKAASDLEVQTLVLNGELKRMLEKLEEIPGKNLQEKLELLQNEYGLSPFFIWRVGQDSKDSDKNVIEIVQKEATALGVDDPEETSQLTSLLYQSDHFKTMMGKILGSGLYFTEESDNFQKLLDLEEEIRGMMDPPLAYESAPLNRYNSMSLTQLEDLAGFINWKKFFNNGFQYVNLNLKIDDSEKIVVWSTQFLSRLSKKLKALQNSPDGQKLVNKYLIWEAGKELFGDIFIANFSSVKNSTVNSVAIVTCSALTQQHLDAAVASIHRRFLLKLQPDLETRRMKMVEKMAENIREELILVLKESEWLDENSRDGAIEKARKTRVLIGFPEGVKNSTLVEQFYDFCPKMNESDFIGNLINLLKAARQKNTKILRTPTDKNGTFGWQKSQDVKTMENNAFHIPELNVVVLPVRNLLRPHFSPDSPESFNYGRIGFTIGHEFFHGFDSYGSNFHGDGKFHSQSLWQTEETREKVENRSSCLVRQYSKFSYPDGQSLNGTQTLEENFADNGGLDVATRAIFRQLSQKNISSSKSSRGKDEKNQNQTLAGFTDEQMFFLSFAQQWCTAEPPKFSKDPHAPLRFRILGALQNSKAFSEAFNCPPKSRMNPEEKYSVF